jgi:hypothetical protein
VVEREGQVGRGGGRLIHQKRKCEGTWHPMGLWVPLLLLLLLLLLLQQTNKHPTYINNTTTTLAITTRL